MMHEEYKKNEPVNIKEILARFTTNIIGSCAFGLECHTLEEEDSEFRVFGRNLFKMTRLESFKRLFAVTFPEVAKFLDLSFSRKDDCGFHHEHGARHN
jgi:cytochrome P450 family 6